MTRRRILSISLLAFLIIAILVPNGNAQGNQSGQRNMKKRTVFASYNSYSSSSSDPAGEANIAMPVEAAVESGEKWVSIFIRDNTGLPVAGEVGQDVNGDGSWDKTWMICQSTGGRLRIKPTGTMYVRVLNEPCSVDNGGTATTGKVQFNFFSLGAGTKPPRTSVPKVERLLRILYTTPAYYEEGSASGTGAYSIQTYSTENYVTVNTSDQTGLPVRVILAQEGSPDVEVCGSTNNPVYIQGGVDLLVQVTEGPCADGTQTAATKGTVDIAISNVP